MGIPVILTYGMGVDSTTILMRWLLEPETRDFELEDLIVLTAMTGDEHASTRVAVETHMLPLLRAHNVRFVQVARAGPHQSDGIVVLSDTRQPHRLFVEGRWKLSQELLAAGTVPQYAQGQRRCSIKYKGDVLDAWVEQELGSQRFRHVIGFNAEEGRRVTRDLGYCSVWRHSEYPLFRLGWIREVCVQYLFARTGITWPKSCCTFCPFAGGKEEALDRLIAEPRAAFDSLRMEHISLALNPNSSLYSSGPLRAFLEKRAPQLVEDFAQRVVEETWAVYRVRRVVWAVGRADRETVVLHRGSASSALQALARAAAEAGVAVVEEKYSRRAWVRLRGEGFPTAEEMLVACPAVPDEKARDNFQRSWRRVTGDEGECPPPVEEALYDAA